MGKRFWFGVILLLVLISVGIFSVVFMDRVCSPVADTLLLAQTLALEGDLSQAVPLAQQAKVQWDARRNLLAVLADHAPMDDMEQQFAELDVYGKQDDATHFAACCGTLAILCRAMVDAHAPAWQNLL